MRSAAARLMILAALAAGLPSPAAPQPTAPKVEVEGTQFRITLADGHLLAQHELPGVRIVLGDGSGRQRTIRIDAVERDPKDRNGEIMLYAMSEQNPTSGDWRNVCLPDPDGRQLGFPLAGTFTADGRYEPSPGGLLITCTGGAEGKCIRFGYKPWGHAPDGTPLAEAYNACVRLVRADYAGDGKGTTRNGQPIDIYDSFGVMPPVNIPAFEFEAGFAADGAVCVRHVRVKENATLAGIEASNTRLAGRVGDMCDEAFARDAGAILFVRSPREMRRLLPAERRASFDAQWGEKVRMREAEGEPSGQSPLASPQPRPG
jgi:ADYC domain